MLKRVDDANIRIPGTKLEGWRAIAVGVVAQYLLLFIAHTVSDRGRSV